MIKAEGYIKYRCIFIKKKLDYIAIMDEINSLRIKLMDLGFIGIYPSKISYGNISYRLSDKTFIITGTQNR